MKQTTAVFLAVLAGQAPAQEQERPPPVFESEAQPAGEPVEIDAYAEFRQGGIFIADGQRVRIGSGTAIEGDVANAREIELGFEFKAWGVRGADGVILAERIEARPNGMAMFEGGMVAASNDLEREWLQAGYVFDDERIVGDIVSYDDRVVRVDRILRSLMPPYLRSDAARSWLVETEIWNASAMANGAIWVYAGLEEMLSDDELAVILGHELAHFTHEHMRRGAKRDMLTQSAAGLAGGALVGMMGGGALADIAGIAASLGATAFTSGYSRDLEDQADRVGLRYAFEAGYDAHAGVTVWQLFLEKFGDGDQVGNFLVGSHSRPSERIENIRREIDINYRLKDER